MPQPSDLTHELQFPAVRAHIYYSAPREALRSALGMLDKLPQIAQIAHVSLSGECGGQSVEAAVVELFLASIRPRVHLAFDALPLGAAHTRLVIRCLKQACPKESCKLLINTVYAELDSLLIGG